MLHRCVKCKRDRCEKCEVKTFEDVSILGEKLTARNDVQVICGPCKHGFCKGWRVTFITKCGVCEHVVCGDCELGQEVGVVPVCCRSGTHDVVVGEGGKGKGKERE